MCAASVEHLQHFHSPASIAAFHITAAGPGLLKQTSLQGQQGWQDPERSFADCCCWRWCNVLQAGDGQKASYTA